MHLLDLPKSSLGEIFHFIPKENNSWFHSLLVCKTFLEIGLNVFPVREELTAIKGNEIKEVETILAKGIWTKILFNFSAEAAHFAKSLCFGKINHFSIKLKNKAKKEEPDAKRRKIEEDFEEYLDEEDDEAEDDFSYSASLRYYPVDPDEIEPFLEVAVDSPFGKKNDTIYDKIVRSSVEIPGNYIGFDSEFKYLSRRIITDIKRHLVPDASEIRLEFYKMVIYRPGDHFKEHKDTIRDVNHFGTLVILPPSEYEGGEFIVKDRNGTQHTFGKVTDRSRFLCDWVAFFTDCDHEVKEVTKGIRVSLIFNLYFDGPRTLSPNPTSFPQIFTSKLMKVFRDPKFQRPKLGFLLEHDYSLSTLNSDLLKGIDRQFFQWIQSSGRFNIELVPVEISDLKENREGKIFGPVVKQEGKRRRRVFSRFSYYEHMRAWDGEAHFLNFTTSHLKSRDINSIDTGNEGAALSFEYLHGAMLFYPKEPFFPVDLKEKYESCYDEDEDNFDEDE